MRLIVAEPDQIHTNLWRCEVYWDSNPDKPGGPLKPNMRIVYAEFYGDTCDRAHARAMGCGQVDD